VAEVAAAVRAAAAADLSSDSERVRPNVVAAVSAQMLSGVEAWLSGVEAWRRAAGVAALPLLAVIQTEGYCGRPRPGSFLLLSGLPRLPEKMVDR
jgi:hypothetical protein